MKIKIAICDDDASQREYLEKIVIEWTKRRHYLTELKPYADAKSFLFDYEEEKDFDILLLDVEMPGINGVELAKEVRRDNAVVQIIFVTGYYEYFSAGFDVSALHYLIKPVNEDKLFPVLDRSVANLNQRQRSVLITTAEADIKIPMTDIHYVEAENVYVVIHTAQGNYKMRCPLMKFSQQLDETFFKVHRSYVVNLKDIVKITKTEIIMTGGDRIPMSRGMYDSVHGALIKYL